MGEEKNGSMNLNDVIELLKIINSEGSEPKKTKASAQLRSLRELRQDDGSNSVFSLPPNFLKQLTKACPNLEIIDLHNTDCKCLTPLRKKSKIRRLDLRNLHLDWLPKFCIKDEIELSLVGTTFAKQPFALFELPPEKVQKTYFDQKRTMLKEGRVVFLGDTDSGKTSTIRRIQAHGKKLSKKTEDTIGIEINNFDCADNIHIQVWDLGGKEIMLSMHQCFMTDRTCYVIVVSNREPGQAMNQARKWLRTVAGFKRVSVLLAVNQWRNVSAERNIDFDELHALCPALKKVLYYSAEDSTKVEFNRNVTDVIMDVVQKQDSFKLELPNSWIEIRKDLLQLEKNYISDVMFYGICASHGLNIGDEDMNVILSWLLDWLNDMGVCFNYRTSDSERHPGILEKYMLLKPEWLTNGIYRILGDGDEYHEDGCLSRSEILVLLKGDLGRDQKYKYEKEEEVEYILQVMRKFGRSYEIDRTIEFIPETLPRIKPNCTVPASTGKPFTYLLEFKYLPESLLHCIMNKMRSWRISAMWYSGFQLQDENAVLRIEKDADSDTLRMELSYLSDEQPHSSTLFHEARSWLLWLCREMNLATKDEGHICLEQDDSYADYELQTLVDAYLSGENISLVSTSGPFQQIPLKHFLFPAFDQELLVAAKRLSSRTGRRPIETLNTICSVYPFATTETIQSLNRKREYVRSLSGSQLFPIEGALKLEALSADERLDALVLLANYDPNGFLGWLKDNGRRIESGKRLQEQDDINQELRRWAKNSPLYHEAIGAFDPTYSELRVALGPNETNRQIASEKLLNAIWLKHPKLGLHPDYEHLKNLEFAPKDPPKYKDHIEHMYKVFLLGLYLYENHSKFHKAINDYGLDDNAFLSVWILAALSFDAGYVIDYAQKPVELYTRMTEMLSRPLWNLFPNDFGEKTEEGIRARSNMPAPRIEHMYLLKNALQEFKGKGRSVQLTVHDDDNPILTYFSNTEDKNDERRYYDHGIVSAGMMLFQQAKLCEYYKVFPEGELNSIQKDRLKTVRDAIPQYTEYVKPAAFAVALHNLKKDWSGERMLDLAIDGVRLDEFRIPLDTELEPGCGPEPIAYLLRLCDELQCWDRHLSIMSKEYSFGGEQVKLSCNAGQVTISFDDNERTRNIKNNIIDALSEFLVPPVEACIIMK